jgi:hypothetical protein
MTRLETAVAYDGLPISRGGSHKLGRVSAREALIRWMHFLETRTEASPIDAFFDLPDTPQLTVDPAVARLIKREFPKARARHGSHVPSDRWDDALALFESLEPLQVNPWGMAPVWLWFTADFRLRSPDGRTIWPGQDPALFGHFRTPGGVLLGASSTRLILEAKRSLGLSISIPRATDEDLVELVPWMQEALPMRLSTKHWTRWTLTKNGASYRGRKIAPAPLA